MDWGSIILALIGSGVVSTIVTAIFDSIRQKREQKAKEREQESKTDTIDIENFHKLIEEERKERELMRREHAEYKKEVADRVAEVKKEMEEMREERNHMTAAILQGYTCKLPETADDCPVIRMYKDCKNCPKK